MEQAQYQNSRRQHGLSYMKKKNAKLDPANYRPISPYYLRVQQAYRTCNAASFSQAKLFAEALSLRITSTRPLAKIILSNLTFP